MDYVVTFGEVMMRFSPSSRERIIQCDHFHSHYSGAEANVAVSLAYYGDKVRFVSKFPDNILGDAAENEIRRFGVDTSFCVRGGADLVYTLPKEVAVKDQQRYYMTEQDPLFLPVRVRTMIGMVFFWTVNGSIFQVLILRWMRRSFIFAKKPVR